MWGLTFPGMIKRVWIGNVEAITDKQTNRQNFNLKTRPHRVKRFKETVLLKGAAKCVMLRPPFIRFVFCVLCAVQCVMLCSPFSHKERGADKTSGAVTLLCSRWIRRLLSPSSDATIFTRGQKLLGQVYCTSLALPFSSSHHPLAGKYFTPAYYILRNPYEKSCHPPPTPPHPPMDTLGR